MVARLARLIGQDHLAEGMHRVDRSVQAHRRPHRAAHADAITRLQVQ
jgi:hypothetical protein